MKRTYSAQNYEAEKLSERNFDISQILNPIEVFIMDIERYLIPLQPI
jgi:hypothetical protein